ncbi:MAG: hypothetical protein IPL79_10065 [Myxococcales bacterium]|nr:hypothetical protein [Myxococcales bacterium]
MAQAQAPSASKAFRAGQDAPMYSFYRSDTVAPNGKVTMRQLVPKIADGGDLSNLPVGGSIEAANAHILYLNMTGGLIAPGQNTSIDFTSGGTSYIAKSTIVGQPTNMPAWGASQAAKDALAACVAEVVAPFNVQVVVTNPGAVAHKEVFIGGTAAAIGESPNVGGIAPYTLDCSDIAGAPSFAFAGATFYNPGGAPDIDEICSTVLQEWAHTYGLDHEMLASDPMTYQNYNGRRTFKDQLVSCGEFGNRLCGLSQSQPCFGGAGQNSHQMLVQRIGASDGSNPPPPGGGGTPPEEGPGGEPGGEPGEGNDPLGGDTTEPGNGYNNNVVGGCQAGGAPSLASLLLAMAAAGLARRRTARKSR